MKHVKILVDLIIHLKSEKYEFVIIGQICERIQFVYLPLLKHDLLQSIRCKFPEIDGLLNFPLLSSLPFRAKLSVNTLFNRHLFISLSENNKYLQHLVIFYSWLVFHALSMSKEHH